MSARPNDERLQELLFQDALEGLDPCERAELDGLLTTSGSLDARGFDRAAAAVHAAALPEKLDEVPAGLRARLSQDAAHFLQGEEFHDRDVAGPATQAQADSEYDSDPVPAPVTVFDKYPRPSAMAYLGWVAAAALLFLWASTWNRSEFTSTELDMDRASLAARADAVVVPWSVTDDEGGQGTQGDVVWSDAEQKGYMRFEGLRANDPAREQYQLWIFDAARSEDHPVDGGVFDVPADGEVIVEIDPKLGVSEASLFAVTLEPPGGVVVSSRERLLLTAAVP